LRRYYAFVKGLPCIITGLPGVDVAHVNAMVRDEVGNFYHFGTGHKGRKGFFCVPLSPRLHRADSDYEFSWHKVGQVAFLRKHDWSEGALAWRVALQLIDFLRKDQE
jgi:hypothetical protein